ncbi:MAG: hypothetical protein Q8933_19030 [Bacteroidota bacterium]|nr:hypothetical protein [Bacteroidota bacterium]
MKPLLKNISFLIILSFGLKAQIYNYGAEYMFFYTQPNARSEAMGKGNSAFTGSPFMSINNPASSFFLKGLNAELTHIDFNYPRFTSTCIYNAYGAGANLGKYGAFSFNYLHFVFGIPVELPEGEALDIKLPVGHAEREALGITLQRGPFPPLPFTNIYMMNYSYGLLENLAFGVNINFFEDANTEIYSKGWLLDAGFMKKFAISSPTGQHNLFLALSFSNLTNTMLEDEWRGQWYLPSVIQIGSVYEFEPKLRAFDFNIFKVLLSAEYYDLLNSSNYTQIRLGTELTILEMLKLRGGWYSENLNDYRDKSTYDIEKINEFTFGFGFDINAAKVMKAEFPLTVMLGYTSFQSPLFYTKQENRLNSPLYSIGLNYGL